MFIVALAFAASMITIAIAVFFVGGYVLGNVMEPLNSTAFELLNGTSPAILNRISGYGEYSLTIFGVAGVLIVAWWILYIYLKASETEYVTEGRYRY